MFVSHIDDLFCNTLNYFMLKKFQTRTSPAAFILVLFLAISFLVSEDTVLCFGKDGHVAVEFVDSCNGVGLGSQLAGGDSDACGPCKDAQFQGSPGYTRNASHNTQTFPLMSSSPMSPSLSSNEYSGKYINLPDYSHHKTLASLHSVVLLI